MDANTVPHGVPAAPPPHDHDHDAPADHALVADDHGHDHSAAEHGPDHAAEHGPDHATAEHGHDHAPAEHGHDGDHNHDHDHDHDHAHGGGIGAQILGMFGIGHGHTHGTVEVDAALEGSAAGIQALRTSLLILGATAAFQLAVAWVSGSAGLLADTIHNFADALTALPLWVAFTLSRRPATRRFTYGYDRAEDVAGVVIVAIIFLSAAVAVWESLDKLLHPLPLRDLWWVAAAAVAGFVGNEWVAQIRIGTGQRIGSAALVADGQHARADGLTSLAVLVGAGGAALGYPLVDAVVGVLITFAILVIGKQAGQAILYRLMDAVDPAVVDQVEGAAGGVAGVQRVHDVRVRWQGHRLVAELHADVDPSLSTVASHAIAEDLRHTLLHALPALRDALVHIDPAGETADHYHETTWHHRNGG